MASSLSVRIAMLHVGRCGSTVVAKMLERTPGLTWEGEIFEPKIRERLGDPTIDPADLIAHRLSLATNGFGFETKYLPSHHLRQIGMGLPDYLELLADLGFTHYVTLHRRNYLRRVVSGAIGRETRTWHAARGATPKPSSLALDPRSVPFGPRQPLLKVFEEMRAGEAMLHELLRGRRILRLVYEDDIQQDPRTAYRAICDFARLRHRRQEVALRPTNPQPLTELLSNYLEIEQLLRGTDYEWMLTG